MEPSPCIFTPVVNVKEELPHKNYNLKAACADFIANGWKIIKADSFALSKDYAYSTFRMLEIKPEEYFYKYLMKRYWIFVWYIFLSMK